MCACFKFQRFHHHLCDLYDYDPIQKNTDIVCERTVINVRNNKAGSLLYSKDNFEYVLTYILIKKLITIVLVRKTTHIAPVTQLHD